LTITPELRHGVCPTYKKVKGFQPLQVTWELFVVDAVFRGGDKHGNHGETVLHTVGHLVRPICRSYCDEVPIVLRVDNAFLDRKLFEECERLHRVGQVL